MNLKEACDLAWERAKGRCYACTPPPITWATVSTRMPFKDDDRWRTLQCATWGKIPHTCYGDIEAVRAVAKAALDSLDIDRQIPAVKAELDKYLEVKHG